MLLPGEKFSKMYCTFKLRHEINNNNKNANRKQK